MKANFILVHGSFVDETAWRNVAPKLEAAGASVSLVTLPGHSDATATGAGNVTLADYVAAVTPKLEAADEPVILVGHSMGGVVITQSAETDPDKIAALVYLSAYLPENGKSLQDYTQDAESKLGPALKMDTQHGVATITADTMRTAFFNNTPTADADAAIKRLRPEPLQPFGTPVKTTAGKFGKVRRFYITTTKDQVIGPAMQKKMYTAQPVERTYTLATDHSSFFSATDDLVRTLLEIRDKVAAAPVLAGAAR